MPAEEPDFRQLVDDYLEDSCQFSPVNAAHLGVHRYDDRFVQEALPIALIRERLLEENAPQTLAPER